MVVSGHCSTGSHIGTRRGTTQLCDSTNISSSERLGYDRPGYDHPNVVRTAREGQRQTP